MDDAKEIKIFIAYSRLNIEFLRELKTFLSPLIRNRSIATWYDGEIVPGEVWEDKIKNALNEAEIFLLLVSADSLASDYFYDKEVNNALGRHQKGESIVVPVILKPCGWRETPLATLQALPLNGRALTTWENKDEAYQSIFDGLKNVIKKIQDKKNLKAKEEKETFDTGKINITSDIQPSTPSGRFAESPSNETAGVATGSKGLNISDDPVNKSRLFIFVIAGTILLVVIFLLAKSCNINYGSIKKGADTTSEVKSVPPVNTGAKITGKIYYNNAVITKYSNAAAVIDLMEVSTRKNASINTQYNNQTGEFILENVPPGKYTAFVRIESGYPYNSESGGDYFSRISGLNDDIDVSPEANDIQANFKVMNVIHLKKPIDNQTLRTFANDPPEKLFNSFYAPSAETFEWDAVPGAVVYEVVFLLMNLNTNALVDNKTERITSTQYSPNLKINPDNTKYMFRVEAYNSNNEHIGTFMNYYKNGSGGSFDFTIAQGK